MTSGSAYISARASRSSSVKPRSRRRIVSMTGAALLCACFLGDELGVLGGDNARAVLSGVFLGELGTEQENLRRIIYPDQHYYDRTCRTERLSHVAELEVEGQRELSQCKE